MHDLSRCVRWIEAGKPFCRSNCVQRVASTLRVDAAAIEGSRVAARCASGRETRMVAAAGRRRSAALCVLARDAAVASYCRPCARSWAAGQQASRAGEASHLIEPVLNLAGAA